MEILKTNELMNVNGGAFNLGIAVTIVGVLVSLVGLIDGFLRPLKCNK